MDEILEYLLKRKIMDKRANKNVLQKKMQSSFLLSVAARD